MSQTISKGVDELVAGLDKAVTAGDAVHITGRVKGTLEELIRGRRLRLADRFRRTRSDTYARRLLHRDPDGRYTAVVMTWGPGQRTGLHDHAGIWCVEGVVEGRMEVTQYDLVDAEPDFYRFVQQARVQAEVGSAGCLIPPFEYHILANALADQSSITLHIYGGDMDSCNVFEPGPDDRYVRRTRTLAFHD